MRHLPPAPYHRSRLRLAAIAALAGWLLALAIPAGAQQDTPDRAGVFDHYLLALTWMPAFCSLDGPRPQDDRCRPGRRLGWLVHGLWPQHRGGSWPEFCPTTQHPPTRTETAAETAFFGSAGAAWHQWNKHGRCTGLSAADYYALTRTAAERLVLPEIFSRIDAPLRVAPAVVAAAFVEANPGLPPEALVTTCRSDALVELRLCLNRDLTPRPCDPETRRCRLDAARLLPLQ